MLLLPSAWKDTSHTPKKKEERNYWAIEFLTTDPRGTENYSLLSVLRPVAYSYLMTDLKFSWKGINISQ